MHTRKLLAAIASASILATPAVQAAQPAYPDKPIRLIIGSAPGSGPDIISRLLSDAMEELCSARTQEDVVRISAALAKKACNVDSISIVLTSGEQFHYAPEDKPDTISLAVRSKVIMRMSAWALEAAQTAVVPDIHRDERTRSHTNGSTFARSLVVVPVGGRNPFAAITCAWVQERWPAATDVLVLEALARNLPNA